MNFNPASQSNLNMEATTNINIKIYNFARGVY
jgi:hypothetical protein